MHTAFICPHCGKGDIIAKLNMPRQYLINQNGFVRFPVGPEESCFLTVTHDDLKSTGCLCAHCGYAGTSSEFDPNSYNPNTDFNIEFCSTEPNTLTTVYTRVKFVSTRQYKTVSRYLRARTAAERQSEDETITITAKFPDNIEMDIKCCGSDTGPSWTEAVLFHNGSELCCTECEDDYLGPWELTIKGPDGGLRTYRTILMPEKSITTTDIETAYYTRRLTFDRKFPGLKPGEIIGRAGKKEASRLLLSDPAIAQCGTVQAYIRRIGELALFERVYETLETMRQTDGQMVSYLNISEYLHLQDNKEA